MKMAHMLYMGIPSSFGVVLIYDFADLIEKHQHLMMIH